MSSSSTVRRVKERGGAGGKITALKPSKTLTPISEKDDGGSNKKPTGKENSRSISATRIPVVCQKPTIRPVPIPRIDKQVGPIKDGDSRVRWSTSSIPRGRSSCPSDFARFLSDRMSRVSVSDRSAKTLDKASMGGADIVVSKGGKAVNGFRVLEKSHSQKASLCSNSKVSEGTENGLTSSEDCKDRVNLSGTSDRMVEKNSQDLRVLHSAEKTVEKHLNAVRAFSKGEVNLKINSTRSGNKDVNFSLEGSKGTCNLDLNVKAMSEKDLIGGRKASETCKEKGNSDSFMNDTVEEVSNGHRVLEKYSDAGHLDSNLKVGKEKALIGFKVLENSKSKGAADEGKGVRVINKYPSKLHEKLAFLEGKVKRIASDIKKTKDMLDMSNPDASKVILSDIQDKISGIEKAMGHVVNDNNGSQVLSNIVVNDNQQAKNSESQNVQVDHSKNSVKGLNNDELEARLFPHHKLLRSRASLSTSSTVSQNDQPHLPEPSGDTKKEDALLSPIDENLIALEFLASLNKNQSKVGKGEEQVGLEFGEIKEMDGTASSEAQDNSIMLVDGNQGEEIRLTTDETIEEFNDQENKPEMVIQEEIEDSSMEQLNEIGRKTSTGGWFVSEGESVLLAHDDSSCSFYDITNSEEKAEYKPPAGVSPNLWGDCWLMRAPGADGWSGRYVVAASSGNTLESGFCVWDFYTKEVRAFRVEDETCKSSSRTVLGPLPNRGLHRRNVLSTIMAAENRQWWYKPCGPLLVSTASSQKVVRVFDIRDGEQVMKWEVQRPVLTMDYSSPLQWRNRGKVVVAETEAISLWDVNSLTAQALLSVASSGRKVSALHVNNTDAELGGGVRRRISSSEVEGNDGVFCTQDTVNVLDFRLPSGVGLKISKLGVSVQSIFSRGDSIFLGCADGRLGVKEQARSHVQQFSLRKGRLVSTYSLPESNAHSHYSAISQVWGNSDLVMGICGLGLFVFDALQNEAMPSFAIDHGKTQQVRDIIGPDDLYSPSFDYLSSRVLVISKDRPALWSLCVAEQNLCRVVTLKGL